MITNTKTFVTPFPSKSNQILQPQQCEFARHANAIADDLIQSYMTQRKELMTLYSKQITLNEPCIEVIQRLEEQIQQIDNCIKDQSQNIQSTHERETNERLVAQKECNRSDVERKKIESNERCQLDNHQLQYTINTENNRVQTNDQYYGRQAQIISDCLNNGTCIQEVIEALLELRYPSRHSIF